MARSRVHSLNIAMHVPAMIDPVCVNLTLVLATHNGALWLPELLRSIGVQTLLPAQVLALDDASTDESLSILHGWKPWGVQVTVEAHTSNQGAIRSFEELLSKVRTEYFALCDQDDVWLPDKLEKSVRLLASSQASLVYTDLQVVDADLHDVAPSMWRLSNIVPVEGHRVIPLVLKNCVTGCTVVGRTTLLKSALPFPEGVPMHDWWLATVGACTDGLTPLNDSTVLYRQHGQNQVGVVPFGARGLGSRLARSHVSLPGYLQRRLSVRLALLAGLQARGLMTRRCFLSWYYSLPALTRFVLNPMYLCYTIVRAPELGLRNLLVDWVLTCMPLPRRRMEARS